MQISSADIEFRHFHLFCGLGGGAKGFNKGTARVGQLRGRWRCIGGVDVDPGSIADFSRAAGVQGTVLDLFDEDQYRCFHGKTPPPEWRPATPADIRRAAHGERPHAAFLSAPCKGFSGLLPEQSSKTAKYQALNRLTLRGVWLMLEAWKDDPVELVVFENVPRIATRGRHLLDQIVALLRAYGYAVAETTHDCGELGGLGQSRKRFLLVARHEHKVPPFLYEPEKRRLRGVGEILERLPLPGDAAGGVMHRMPALQWKTWVRLAFVEAGSDWRSLNRLAVENGVLRDFGMLPDREWQASVLGVHRWEETAGVIAGRSSPTNGAYSVADPRFDAGGEYSQYGVRRWGEPTGSVINVKAPGQGAYSVADPRVDGHPKSVQLGIRRWTDTAAVVKGDVSVGTGPYAVADPTITGKPRFNNVFRIVPWGDFAPAVAGPGGPAGGLAVADPRPGKPTEELQGNWHITPFDAPAHAVVGNRKSGASAVADPRPAPRDDYKQTKYRVTGMDEPAGTVIAASSTGNGAFAVADPRPVNDLHKGAHGVRDWSETSGTVQGESLPSNGAFAVADPRPAAFGEKRENYQTGGHYGVIPWRGTAYAVPGYAKHDRGNWSVADPRDVKPEQIFELPRPEDRLVAVIRALDGTWHRPFTTLELAALQSLVDPDDVGSFALDGQSDSAWRERIGNAVPPDAAEAIAGVMATTLLLAMSGETFMLSNQPIWVQPIALALAVDQRGNIPHE